MNKAEFIEAIAEKSGVARKDVANTFGAMTEVITEALKNNNKIAIAGFGNFEVRERAARTGRNPSTGETISVPAKKVPAFKPGKLLKEAIK